MENTLFRVHSFPFPLCVDVDVEYVHTQYICVYYMVPFSSITSPYKTNENIKHSQITRKYHFRYDLVQHEDQTPNKKKVIAEIPPSFSCSAAKSSIPILRTAPPTSSVPRRGFLLNYFEVLRMADGGRATEGEEEEIKKKKGKKKVEFVYFLFFLFLFYKRPRTIATQLMRVE